ncbi:phosphate transport system substrate-binding protein [Methylomarinovum tepidoasis]|uniref:Phosphate transport system substrate-binding protein n=1 Tax=Methylomarinovum tepidoasis TaxID=2840183 RepID=A0AAU9D1J4_9GAMM|nr:substrate-binding domain-containing protein [Methylomarinovum sp. IN45]BCX88854.1 phosphate transport system substrate-binding protein [Methylomarinovum sp. IN45]
MRHCGRCFVLTILLGWIILEPAASARPLRLVTEPLLAPVAAAWIEPRPDASRQTANALTAVQTLIQGRADAVAIARPLTPAERRLLPRPVLSLPVGLDGIALYVRRDAPLQSLSLGVLERLFFATNRCHPTAPPVSLARRFGLAAATARHFQFSAQVGCGRPLAGAVAQLPGDRDVIDAVAATPGAIGFASASLAPAKGVRALALARRPDGRPVPPNRITLGQGRYPLTHYLYLHFYADRQEAVELARHALSPPGQHVLARRFTALPNPLRIKALQRLTAPGTH